MAEQLDAFDEIWLPVPGWPEYHVSTQGRVCRSAVGRRRGVRPWRILSPSWSRSQKSKNIYLKVGLSRPGQKRKWYYVHRLVALTFLGEPYIPDAVVDHKNGDTIHNPLTNLQWTSQGENVKHAWDRTRKPRLEDEDLPF